MNYRFAEDISTIREMLGLSQTVLAEKLGVQQVSLSRYETGKTTPSPRFLEKLYGFAYESGIKLGILKEMLWFEEMKNGHKLLFHGAKSEIEGELRVDRSRTNNDFGPGFYTGESYDQAVSFVSAFEQSSVYYLDFKEINLKCKKYEVNREWMLTIAYYRQNLEKYSSHPLIRQLVEDSKNCDYIVAPIADNRMFRIINSFIEGEITDEQCKHCLAATNLGNQYVFISNRAINNVSILERGYISSREREYYMDLRTADAKLGDDKAKLARIQYRGKGRYIDEILK